MHGRITRLDTSCINNSSPVHIHRVCSGVRWNLRKSTNILPYSVPQLTRLQYAFRTAPLDTFPRHVVAQPLMQEPSEFRSPKSKLYSSTNSLTSCSEYIVPSAACQSRISHKSAIRIAFVSVCAPQSPDIYSTFPFSIPV